MVRVLLVEDDASIGEPLQVGLQRHGYDVTRVGTGREALDAADVEMVLLDLGLPDIDGYDVCRTLRARSDVPIIVLTARRDEIDRVVGLEIGADDYLVKPFGFRELVARMRAVMRRVGQAPRTTRTEPAATLELGPLVLDVRTRRVTLSGSEIALTPKEFDLLALLMDEAGGVIRRDEILRRVWDENWYGPTKTLDVHVATLRKKLGDPAWIETVRGVGFRVASPP